MHLFTPLIGYYKSSCKGNQKDVVVCIFSQTLNKSLRNDVG